MGNVNVIRRLEDENYQFNLKIDGAFEHVEKNRQKSQQILRKLDSSGRLQLDWKKSLNLNNHTFGCITKVEVLDKDGVISTIR